MTHGMRLALLRAVSWIVPRDERADWLAEWIAELCYIERVSACGTEFCRGSLRDAWWLRRNNLNPVARRILRMETPSQCLGLLGAAAGAMALLVLSLPSARNFFSGPPYREPFSLVVVSVPDVPYGQPSVSIEKYRRLAAAAIQPFSSIAFVQPATGHVQIRGRDVAVSMARASGQLFDLLGLRLTDRRPALVLRESTWRRLHGRGLSIAGNAVDSAGIVSDGAWRLPGKFEAWLLVDDSKPASFPDWPNGFVIARGRGLNPTGSFWYVNVPVSDEERDHYECRPPFPRGEMLAGIASLVAFTFMILAVTRVSLGHNPTANAATGAPRLRRWLFLLAKTALVSMIMTCALSLTFQSPVPQMAVVSFILAFRWVLHDQGRRCPVCLRVLSNPVRIGRPSQTFLEWYGTELICSRGHGLLHVCEISNSCYSGQKWTGLDTSWSSLFSEPAGHQAAR